jgi:hypothetical protein
MVKNSSGKFLFLKIVNPESKRRRELEENGNGKTKDIESKKTVILALGGLA